MQHIHHRKMLKPENITKTYDRDLIELSSMVVRNVRGKTEDGIFVEDIKNDKKIIKLASEISLEELDKIKLADLGNKIDVTGSIRGKLHVIKEICRLNIPVQVINGLTDYAHPCQVLADCFLGIAAGLLRLNPDHETVG